VAWLNEIVGDGWTPLILRDAMLGLRRFEDFHRYQGIGRNTLSQRLSELVDAGLMRTEIYQVNPPRREYVLTDKGRELFAVLSTMVAWSERWLEGAAGLVEFHHRCGERTQAQVVCSCCGEPLELADVEFRLGSEFPERLAGRSDIERRFGTREA
jgi:DNA-binding HxlR family transcriptional regulator